MDKPSPKAYEVIQLFLELWELRKGEPREPVSCKDRTASKDVGSRKPRNPT